MNLKPALLIAACSALIAGCNEEATTQLINAETPDQAMLTYFDAVCANDFEQVKHQMHSPEYTEREGFNSSLQRSSDNCQAYGGIASISLKKRNDFPSGELVWGFPVIAYQGGHTETYPMVKMRLDGPYWKVTLPKPYL